jgi:hypothetical protein
LGQFAATFCNSFCNLPDTTASLYSINSASASAVEIMPSLAKKRRLLTRLVDPLVFMPAEITTLILGNLDAPSLIQAELVSRHWREVASSCHVWKTVFLNKFEPTIHVSPTPIQMGGVGVGKFTANGKHAPAQEWKNMYKARKTINRRWAASTPSAIYLNGHTDSVYCCQFDEYVQFFFGLSNANFVLGTRSSLGHVTELSAFGI